MIKINLLPTERKASKKKFSFNFGQQTTAICAAILVFGGAIVGWRFWQIRQETAAVDQSIADAQRETNRLHGVITQMQQFEQRKTQLQQRVTLIEQLRQEQIGPVHMLDQISLALPPTMWLSEIKQTATPGEVLIEGRSLALTGLSDFVANLERSGFFQRSVEIVNSTTETNGRDGETTKFQIKALFKSPGAAAAAAAAATVASAGKDPANQLKPKG